MSQSARWTIARRTNFATRSRGPEDIARLPSTGKTDLRDEYPLGLIAQDAGQVVRMRASGGATGKPILTAYTRADLDLWGQVIPASGGRQQGGVTGWLFLTGHDVPFALH